MEGLEAKIGTVLEGVSSRLSQDAIPSGEYSRFVFGLLKDQKILNGKFDFDNAKIVGFSDYDQ